MVLATTLSFRHQSFLPSSPSSPQGHSNRIQTGAQSASHDYKDMGFKFIIQDREVVCEMGEKVNKSQLLLMRDGLIKKNYRRGMNGVRHSWKSVLSAFKVKYLFLIL